MAFPTRPLLAGALVVLVAGGLAHRARGPEVLSARVVRVISSTASWRAAACSRPRG